MNEDGNNVAPLGPIFSDPSDKNPPFPPAPSESSQPITSPIVSSDDAQPAAQPLTSGTAPTVDNTQPITSGFQPAVGAAQPAAQPIITAPAPVQKSAVPRSFSSRRFKSKAQPSAASPAFTNAPAFFQEAANNNAAVTLGDSGQQNGSSKKKIFIGIAVVGVLAVVAVVCALMLPQKGKTANENVPDITNLGELADALVQYKQSYGVITTVGGYSFESDRQDDYDKTNKSLALISSKTAKYAIDEIAEQKKTIDDFYSRFPEKSISKKYSEYEQIYQNVNSNIENITYNLNLVTRFNSAFVDPLKGNASAGECQLNDEANSLMGDSATSEAAQLYKTAYCDLRNNTDQSALSDSLLEEIGAARHALALLLKEVNSGNDEMVKTTKIIESIGTSVKNEGSNETQE